jgi:hypothetical protein
VLRLAGQGAAAGARRRCHGVELDGDGRVRVLGAVLPVKGERPADRDKVDVLVRPERVPVLVTTRR